MEITSERQWIKEQGKCCIVDCNEDPTQVDNMDNVFCDDCAEQNQLEEPENWEQL